MLVRKRKIIGYYGPICDMLAENDNRDPLLRHAGVFALQHMAPDSKILRALSFHKSPAVRLAAVVALRRMKSPDLDIFIRDPIYNIHFRIMNLFCRDEVLEANSFFYLFSVGEHIFRTVSEPERNIVSIPG